MMINLKLVLTVEVVIVVYLLLVPGLTEVVDDTTPQLGGDLDVNGKNIISASTNEDIQLIPKWYR